jgi:hypothetical protein
VFKRLGEEGFGAGEVRRCGLGRVDTGSIPLAENTGRGF